MLDLEIKISMKTQFKMAANFCSAKNLYARKTQFFARKVREIPLLLQKNNILALNHLNQTNDLMAFD
jgi:hypothetical protein